MAKPTSRLGRGLGSLISGGSGATPTASVAEPEDNVVNGTATFDRESAAERNGNNTEFSSEIPEQAADPDRLLELPVNDLRPNPRQPRKTMDPTKVGELAASIKAEGLLQPVVVRKVEEGYEIIAGERRWRAHRQLERPTILVRVVDATDLSSATLSLVENLQREGLNPLEEALGYSSLVNDFNLTQALVAERVGKSRTYVTNMLRLLQLDERLRNLVASGQLSVGHAKALLGVEDEEVREKLAFRAVREGWTVRECELAIGASRTDASGTVSRRGIGSSKVPVFRETLDRLSTLLQVEAKVTANKSCKGKLIIPFADEKEFRRIAEAIGV